MRIKYTIPADDNMEVVVSTPLGDNGVTTCEYIPEPVAGLRFIPAGKFRAVGDSGRVEEAVVQFDLRKGEFVIQPKKIVAAGFDFDKPAVEAATTVATIATPTFPPNASTPVGKK